MLALAGAVPAGAGLAATRHALVRVDALPTVAVRTVAAGIDSRQSGGYEPPDVQVAAGPGTVVELVNAAGRIWRTGGGEPKPLPLFQLGDFFRTGNDDLSDPRVLYDASSGRFLASIFDEDRSSVVVAASRTSDPAGEWAVYSFPASGCPDQPRLGVADATVVLAADLFSSCSEGALSRPIGGEVWVLAKQDLLAGAASVALQTFGPSRAYVGLTPAQSLSPTGVAYAAAVDTVGSSVSVVAVRGVPPAPVTLDALRPLDISPLDQPPDALQPSRIEGGRPAPLPTNDNRVLDAVWEDGRLWLSANGGCRPVNDAVTRSCARVVQISTDAQRVDWDADLSEPGGYLFFPALRPDAAGNLLVVYGFSSPQVAPEVVAVARTPDGTWTQPTLLGQSAGSNEGRRYGDYFGAARDPLDPSVVWVAGELGTEANGAGGWSTALAAVSVSGGSAPAVKQSKPPRLVANAATGRVGRPLRLSYTALDDAARVREHVTVARGAHTVFSGTTPSGSVRAHEIYYVLWTPKRRGAYRFCAQAVDAVGRDGVQTCATVTVR